MKASELEKPALKGRAFYIEGDDLYWVDYACRFFISLVAEEYRDLNLKIIGSLGSVAELRDAVNTYSMFPSDTVVLVKDPDYKEAARDKGVLEKIAAELPPDVYLVLTGKNLITTPALRKAFEKIDASRLDESDLRAAMKPLLPAGGIQPRASELLFRFCNRDMARISTELQKLSAYKNGGQITEDDVRQNVADTAENAIYELSNALARGDHAKANEILTKFISEGVAYSYMLAALEGQYRRMLYAALSPLSDAELAKAAGMNEYAVKKAREASRRYTKTRLKTCLDTLTEAETAFKSGVMGEDTALLTAVGTLFLGEEKRIDRSAE